MAKTLNEILEMAWEKQADYLQGLSCRELEVLMFVLVRSKPGGNNDEAFDRFFLAVYSVLRDCRESNKQGTEEAPNR